MVLGLAGAAAAESLPPLRIDPVLLAPAGAVAAPQPIPALSVSVAPAASPSSVAPAASRQVGATPPSANVPAAVAAPLRPVEAASGAAMPAKALPAEAIVVPAGVAPDTPAKPVPTSIRAEPQPSQSVPKAQAAVEPRAAVAPAAAPAAPEDDAVRTTFISADRLQGRNDFEMVAEGAAELRRGRSILNADRLTYQQIEDEVDATGNVRLQRDDSVFTGPHLRMKVADNVGVFEQPSYTVTRQVAVSLPGPQLPGTVAPRRPMTGRGTAESVEFEGENLYHLKKAKFSTCAAGNDAWYAQASDLSLDFNKHVAEGGEGKVVFKDVPILYSPWLSFSLDNERKSGLLAPSIGSTSRSGMEVLVPWYWNIAPNMDATFAPRAMAKRGTQWNADFRYLNHTYAGESHVEYLPNDLLEHKSRYAYVINHRYQDTASGLSGNLIFNSVSDDTYFSDLTKPAAGLGQGNQLRQGGLGYAGSWWGASLILQRYQVLRDPALPPALEPYRRLPQLNLTANRYDLPAGGVFNFTGEYVDFSHPTSVVGQRNTLYPQLSLPIQTSAMQVTPKIGVSATHYRLSRQGAGVPEDQSRVLPIASVDGSLVFERSTDLFGRSLTQTLEPRLYYLYVPYRDQSRIPVFDTGIADFNFAQIFAENRYGGGDRIADANQLTAAVTSRLIDPATGAELLRAVVGQRYYFDTQHVALPAVIAADGTVTTSAETPRTGRSADLLAALSGKVMDKTYADTGWQYNPRDRRTERLNLGGRYQPETGKVLNAGYRYTRDLLGQIDVSAQWPLGGGWHAVGRYNYSTKDDRMIESVGGMEYDGGCWVLRVVVQRIATQTQLATTSLFLQLELNGLSRMGTNPLDVLRRSVPGYSLINQPVVTDPASMYR